MCVRPPWRTLICIGADRRQWRMQGGGDGAKQGARGRAPQALYGKAAEWHSLPSSMGVTANFFAVTCEKMRHEGGKAPYEERLKAFPRLCFDSYGRWYIKHSFKVKERLPDMFCTRLCRTTREPFLLFVKLGVGILSFI